MYFLLRSAFLSTALVVREGWRGSFGEERAGWGWDGGLYDGGEKVAEGRVVVIESFWVDSWAILFGIPESNCSVGRQVLLLD